MSRLAHLDGFALMFNDIMNLATDGSFRKLKEVNFVISHTAEYDTATEWCLTLAYICARCNQDLPHRGVR